MEEHDAVRDNLRMAGRFRDTCVSSQVMARQRSCWSKNLCEKNGPNESLCHHVSGNMWISTKPGKAAVDPRHDGGQSPAKKP